MKKIILWISIAASVIVFIDLAVMGIKLFNGNYSITAEAVIALLSLAALLFCNIIRIFSHKCPYCGKLLVTNGNFCPHRGKKTDDDVNKS